MPDFSSHVIDLSEAAWRLRRAAPKPCDLPFALALFSDPERMPDLEDLVSRLPKDIPPIAVIFRHDQLETEERIALAETVMTAVQARGHLFLMARATLQGADGAHAFSDTIGIRTAPAHDEDEIVAAYGKADAVFLSPIFPTESHPGQRPLTRSRAVALAQAAPMPVFALGGMTPAAAARLEGTDFQGFGAIGAFADSA